MELYEQFHPTREQNSLGLVCFFPNGKDSTSVVLVNLHFIAK